MAPLNGARGSDVNFGVGGGGVADNTSMITAAPSFCLPTDVAGRVRLAGRQVHFVGIAGAGMAGLARMVRQRGARCTGSDVAEGPVVDALRCDGFDIALEQGPASVPHGCDLVVASAAIGPDHPEIAEAERRGLPVRKYAAMLGEMMRGRTGVAVAGTHGKSTTTSMLSHVLIRAELDPSFIVGANCAQIGGGSRTGESDILVAEACEYDRSFHNLNPTHATILNIEEDHLDCYGSLEGIIESFASFARRLPAHGSLLIGHEIPHREAVTAGLACPVETIGFSPDADWHVEISLHQPAGTDHTAFDESRGHGHAHRLAALRKRAESVTRLHHHGEPVCQWSSPLPGAHMAYNAAVAAVTARRLGGEWDQIAAALSGFRGLDRRMQWLGERWADGDQLPTARPVTVVDDYGHHPTEISATLHALRAHHRPERLICVFQPHQHSRTRFLLEAFAESFEQADGVIVPNIYFVRDTENERQAVTASDLVDRLREKGVNALHMHPLEAIVDQLELMSQPGDLVVTMGAGDVWTVARDFLARTRTGQAEMSV